MHAKPPHIQVAKIELSTKMGKFDIYELPAYCPRCRRSALPTVFGSATVSRDLDEIPDELTLDVPVRCSHCELAYVAEYDGFLERHTGEWVTSFATTIPNALPKTVVSDTMKRISPEFARVYDEAVAAQSGGLEELAGAGYRRALEFLVKDYLVYKTPERRETYVRTALGNCIKDHIDEHSIKTLAGRAASIGNDFVHYQMFERQDIRELTSLIDLVHKWIDLREEIDLVQKRLEPPSDDEQKS